MDPRVARLCISTDNIIGPHNSSEIDIFVNDKVIAYRKLNLEGHFYPVGSVFIKEKYSSSSATRPDVATIMLKRSDQGTIDDWEFRIVSLPDYQPISTERRVSCASCHSRYSERGFISNQSELALKSFLQSLSKSTGGAAAANP